jgi:hypothetical protein
MIRLLVSGIARTFAEPPSRDTAATASTGPIPLSDAQLDQVTGAGQPEVVGQGIETAVEPSGGSVRANKSGLGTAFNAYNPKTSLCCAGGGTTIEFRED